MLYADFIENFLRTGFAASFYDHFYLYFYLAAAVGIDVYFAVAIGEA